MNFRHAPVKIKEMNFKTEYVSGKTFKLTLSNSTKEIRYKIPEQADVDHALAITGAVFAFLKHHMEYEVEFTLRGDIKYHEDGIVVILGTPTNRTILKSENAK